ncbi:MAG: glycogen debranching enzyme GlgX, partial [Phycisphaerae bacterium]|nr:glycogen debranching enzyme GlgX [Phycisphaerae bacterium]
FRGSKVGESETEDLTWFRPDGALMTGRDWGNPGTRCFGFRIAGDAIDDVDEHGHPVVDDTLLILLNAHTDPIDFVLPKTRAKQYWELLLDTYVPCCERPKGLTRQAKSFKLEAHSLAVMRLGGT